MKTQFTPGPWEIVASLAGNDRLIIEAYGFGSIAAISLNGAPKHQSKLPAESPYHQRQSDTMLANARLIASAPDMHEALRVFAHSYEKWNKRREGGEDDLHYAAKQIKELLAKIKGNED